MNHQIDPRSIPADEGDLLAEFLRALYEPAAIVSIDGRIQDANPAFRRRIGPVSDLTQLPGADTEDLRRYLMRSSSSPDPLLGVIHISKKERFRARGSLVRFAGRRMVLLRLFEPDERFVRLTETVRELNALIRRREHEKAHLQEALRDRDLMHRELQHRVKNNVQMLAGLLHASQAEAPNDEARKALEEAARRLSAVSAAHQSLYQVDSLSSISAPPLIREIVEAAVQSSTREVQLQLQLDDVRLPNDTATPLALIANELVTNALKHALTDGSGLILSVNLARSGDEVHFSVADNGTGFHSPAALKRSSGLGLVRGLLRQLRGKFAVDQTAGTRFNLSFPA